MFKKLILVSLVLFSTNVFAGTDGIYDGIIDVYPTKDFPAGRKVPITISLKRSKIEMPPINSDNIFQYETKIEGSFVLDQEAGPFFFASSEYDPLSGNLTLLYARVGSTGAPSSIPNLTFECVRKIDPDTKKVTCSGELTSLKGAVGKFTLTQTETVSRPLSVTPKYVGVWQGNMNYTDAALQLVKTIIPNATQTMPYNLKLVAGTGTATNPDIYELASTPMKIGMDYMSTDTNFITTYSAVYIDYFKGEASLQFINGGPGAPPASTMALDFQQDDDSKKNMSIKGKLVGQFGDMGTVQAGKVQ